MDIITSLDISLILFGGALLLFFLILIGVAFLSAYLSRWKSFVAAYPARAPSRGKRVRNLNVRIGPSHYGGHFLSLISDIDHLHVRPSVLLWPSHRSFSIPWADLKIKPHRSAHGVPDVELRCRALSGALIMIVGPGAERLAQASEGRIQLPEKT